MALLLLAACNRTAVSLCNNSNVSNHMREVAEEGALFEDILAAPGDCRDVSVETDAENYAFYVSDESGNFVGACFPGTVEPGDEFSWDGDTLHCP
jgi:hypothetical protein